ncbi:2-C-methyl-D-erythritol 4-phosphate cytidylyltransferase [Marchantia polymorpha subsp. ruderalis]|uniref:2-C-methyl-D-erythritol 4-phosphate cytidylyltransferase, chloroplastic n=2 Tax=Marchantia polymorpha TaxID=3197 RepID=A0AAF6AY45_MARPO|nr:hypothetical protein MARPO_0006s0146 [Marchantia polymorpha]BBN04679.1 hypothetical protein Mp_3g06780 [Marchantia polymorpha subsp. ruderalis]|eukprot:PTQ48117.1 hypothetical protein MARPO_0006s0146 [Marchantia polymorpha]
MAMVALCPCAVAVGLDLRSSCTSIRRRELAHGCALTRRASSFERARSIASAACFSSSRGLSESRSQRNSGASWISCAVSPASASATAQSTKNDDLSSEAIPERSVSVILLAGGKGKRMGANMPKQYLPLLGQPIALYSFHTFASMAAVGEIIVVCDPSYRDIFEEANISIPLKFALPGKERQDSVRSGLQEISETSKLACIHDSARPLVLISDILKVIKDAMTHGAAVLGVPCKATIKQAGSDLFVTKTLDRKTLWEMQTPQVIEPALLRKGFELVEREGLEVTDDVSIVEYLKHPVLITEGSYTNLKVTTPDDLLVAERILHQK